MTTTLRSRVLPVVLLAAGLALVVWLVVQAGPAAVWQALRDSERWLPAIVGLEALMAVLDAVAVRGLLGPIGAQVPAAGWVRATGLAYGACILLPAGRLTGEAVRAGSLGATVGIARATRACARLQACALVGNAVISAIGIAVLFAAPQRPTMLLLALTANGVACGALATAVFVLASQPRVGAWLRKRLARFLPPLDGSDPAVWAVGQTLPAIGLCTLARVLQALQYGLVVVAVGGSLGVTNAFAAQAIHLVGAAVGDAIPGQLGATEGSYRAFAHVLGFAANPARALAVALVMRAVQLTVAAGGLLIGFAAGRFLSRTESA